MKVEYIYKILSIIRDYNDSNYIKITKTDIMKKLNITYKTGSEIIGAFIRVGLLDRKDNYYYITEDGVLLLNELDITYQYIHQLRKVE